MKKFLAIALAATAMVWAADPIEIVGNGGFAWWAGEPWGTADVTINSTEPLDVSVKGDGQGIAAAIAEGSFTGLASIDITYSSTAALRLSFNTAEAVADGYSTFRVLLPKKASSGKVTIPLGDIKRPDWAGLTGEMDFSKVLADVTGIFILTLSDDASAYVNGDFVISSFVLNFGGGGGTHTHSWSAWSTTVEPTCDAAGEEKRTCSAAGCTTPTETKVIAQLTDCGDDIEDIIELIGWEYTLWSSYTDGDEPQYTASDSKVTVESENPLKATLKLGGSGADAPEGGAEWPYLGLGVYLEEGAFAKFTTVEVTYTSSASGLKIGIGLLSDNGSGEEATYEATLPAGSNTKSFGLADFKKPGWTPDGFNGPANLSLANVSNLVAGIVFFHEEYGQTIEIEVTSLKVDGQGGESSIQKPFGGVKSAKSATLAITGIYAGKLGLNVPTSGNYSIALYSVDGRMIAQTKTNLVRGVNTIALGKNLAKGITIVRIQGMNTQLVKKIMVK